MQYKNGMYRGRLFQVSRVWKDRNEIHRRCYFNPLTDDHPSFSKERIQRYFQSQIKPIARSECKIIRSYGSKMHRRIQSQIKLVVHRSLPMTNAQQFKVAEIKCIKDVIANILRFLPRPPDRSWNPNVISRVMIGLHSQVKIEKMECWRHKPVMQNCVKVRR
jgi:hypothetical protein